MLCFDCAMKHLSSALVALKDEGREDGLQLIGDLSHAEIHLVPDFSDEANRVRELRKVVMDAIILDEPIPEMVGEKLQELFNLVKRWAKEDTENGV